MPVFLLGVGGIALLNQFFKSKVEDTTINATQPIGGGTAVSLPWYAKLGLTVAGSVLVYKVGTKFINKI